MRSYSSSQDEENKNRFWTKPCPPHDDRRILSDARKREKQMEKNLGPRYFRRHDAGEEFSPRISKKLLPKKGGIGELKKEVTRKRARYMIRDLSVPEVLKKGGWGGGGARTKGRMGSRRKGVCEILTKIIPYCLSLFILELYGALQIVLRKGIGGSNISRTERSSMQGKEESLAHFCNASSPSLERKLVTKKS